MLAAVAGLRMPLRAEPVERLLTLALLLLLLSAGVTDKRLSVVFSCVTLSMGSADGKGAEPAMVAVPQLVWKPASGDAGDSFQGGLIPEPGTGHCNLTEARETGLLKSKESLKAATSSSPTLKAEPGCRLPNCDAVDELSMAVNVGFIVAPEPMVPPKTAETSMSVSSSLQLLRPQPQRSSCTSWRLRGFGLADGGLGS